MINPDSDGTQNAELKEFKILVQKSDLEFINYLKNQNNITQDELRALGLILIQSLRGFCE